MRLLECTHARGTCRKREKRKMEESLRKVKTLGQAEEDIDDLAKWVTKSRSRAEEEKELAREEALAAAARRQAEQVRPTCNCVVLHMADYACSLLTSCKCRLFAACTS